MYQKPNRKKAAFDRAKIERERQQEIAYEQHTPIQVMRQGKKKR